MSRPTSRQIDWMIEKAEHVTAGAPERPPTFQDAYAAGVKEALVWALGEGDPPYPTPSD